MEFHGNSIETIETMAISETGNHANAKVDKKKYIFSSNIIFSKLDISMVNEH